MSEESQCPPLQKGQGLGPAKHLGLRFLAAVVLGLGELQTAEGSRMSAGEKLGSERGEERAGGRAPSCLEEQALKSHRGHSEDSKKHNPSLSILSKQNMIEGSVGDRPACMVSALEQ